MEDTVRKTQCLYLLLMMAYISLMHGSAKLTAKLTVRLRFRAVALPILRIFFNNNETITKIVLKNITFSVFGYLLQSYFDKITPKLCNMDTFYNVYY